MTRTLRRPIFVMAAMLIAAMWFASAAQAQMPCGERDTVVGKLGEIYGETRRGAGLVSGAVAIFEIWASDKPPRTWTILKTTPNGWTCVLAVGDGWQDDVGNVTPIGDPA